MQADMAMPIVATTAVLMEAMEKRFALTPMTMSPRMPALMGVSGSTAPGIRRSKARARTG